MNIYFPPTVNDPRQMPELRAAFIEFAARGGAWEQTEQQRSLQEMVTGGSGHPPIGTSDGYVGPRGFDQKDLQEATRLAMARGVNSLDWYRTHLRDAQLIYVTDEMAQVVDGAAESVPGDHEMLLEDSPCPTGMVVFGSPLWGLDSSGRDDPIRVDGVLWGLTKLPPRDADWAFSDDYTIPAVSVAAFRLLSPSHGDPMAREWYSGGMSNETLWIPLGRTDWPIGDRLDTPPREAVERDSVGWRSMEEDRRWLASLWAVLQQRRLVERYTIQADRPARRRLERAGHSSPEVEVVHLRQPEYKPREGDGEGRKVSVRHMVKPHWRRQAYGPGRSKRRLTLIPPHIRGPQDAPLKNTERVWSLDQ